jgi:hypothetical protein
VVVADRVPVTLPMDHAVGIQLPLGHLAKIGPVTQPDPPPLTHPSAERQHYFTRRRCSRGRHGKGDRLLEHPNPPAKMLGHHPLDLGEGAVDRRGNAGEPEAAGRDEAER